MKPVENAVNFILSVVLAVTSASILFIWPIVNIYNEYKSPAKLNNKRFELRKMDKSYKVEWRYIAEIIYVDKKTKKFYDYILLFDRSGKKITVDFFFENYEELWREIVERSKEANKDVRIDKRLLERLGMELKE